ncbi:MAG: hypothetical protein VB144_03930 [Clostridia bacterium]|nr:hypothetical protein [Clostridia bacterium]
MGANPKSGMHRVWKELGAVQGRQFVAPEEFSRYEARDGQSVIFCSDVDRFERHLIELAPQDAGIIKDLTQGIRRLAGMDMPVDADPIGMLRLAPRMIPAMGYMKKYGPIHMRDYANRFSSPLLREAMASVADLPDYPALGLLMPLALRSAGNGGYPLGGSLAFSEAIARQVIAALGERFPGIGEQVEVVDVATPMTYERYTGNWRASFEGWLISTRTMPMMMSGQWTTIGGAPGG